MMEGCNVALGCSLFDGERLYLTEGLGGEGIVERG